MHQMKVLVFILVCLTAHLLAQDYVPLLSSSSTAPPKIKDGYVSDVDLTTIRTGGTTDKDGNVLFFDEAGATSLRLRRYNPKTRYISTVPIYPEDGDTPVLELLSGTSGSDSPTCKDRWGACYLHSKGQHAILKVSYAGVIERFAGVWGTAGTVDGPAETALFNAPKASFVDEDTDSLYIISNTATEPLRQLDLNTKMVTTHPSIIAAALVAKCPGSTTMMVYYTTGTKLQVYDVNSKQFGLQTTSYNIAAMACAGDVLYFYDTTSKKVWTITNPASSLTATLLTGTGTTPAVDGVNGTASIGTLTSFTLSGNYIIFPDTGMQALRKIDITTGEISTMVQLDASAVLSETDTFGQSKIPTSAFVFPVSLDTTLMISGPLWILNITAGRLRILGSINLLTSAEPGISFSNSNFKCAMDRDSFGNIYTLSFLISGQYKKLVKLSPVGNAFRISLVIGGTPSRSIQVTFGRFPQSSISLGSGKLFMLQDRYLYLIYTGGLSVIDVVERNFQKFINAGASALVDGDAATATIVSVYAWTRMDENRILTLEKVYTGAPTQLVYRIFDNTTMTFTSYPSNLVHTAAVDPAIAYFKGMIFGMYSRPFINYNFTGEVFTARVDDGCVQTTSTTPHNAKSVFGYVSTNDALFALEAFTLREIVFTRPFPPQVNVTSKGATSITFSMALDPSEWGGLPLQNLSISYFEAKSNSTATVTTTISPTNTTSSVSNLKPATDYIFSFAAANSEYVSASKTMKIKTGNL